MTKKKELNPWILKFFFGFMVFINILINCEHGCIPAATENIRHMLNEDNMRLGTLGSVVYIGLLVGSFIAPPTFHHVSAKLIILICCAGNFVFLLIFSLVKEFWVLCFSRLLVGFFEVFLCIYFPVWVDVFAGEKRKTIWLTILQSSVPLGIVLGYIMTAILDHSLNWQASY